MASRPARQSTAPLRLEQLERRELMAGDLGLSSVDRTTDGLCGPQPLEPPTHLVTYPPGFSQPASGPTYSDPGEGNITAEVIDGVLTIRGDDSGNRIRIYAYRDSGLSGGDWISLSDGGGGFESDGKFYLEEIGTVAAFDIRYPAFSGVTAIDIDLGAGDDSVTIFAVKTPQLTIRTGAGKDEVILHGALPVSSVHGRVWIENPVPVRTGPLTNWQEGPQPLLVDGDLFIDTGAGDDQLSPFAHVAGDATVQMGTGDDSYIEAPYETHRSLVRDPVTGYYRGSQVIGKLTADGALSIDMGADQDVEIIPNHWSEDTDLAQRLQNVPRVLEFYQGLIERGESTPGVAQIITPPFPDVPVQIDAEGRLEIEFGFTKGLGRVIERLQARGVTIDAYSIARGAGRAVIRAEDLRLFGNLPGIGYFMTRSYLNWNQTFSVIIDPEWDYVRPSSATAAEVAEHERRTAAELASPVIGPPELKNVSIQTGVSLRDWYYSTGKMGPEPLQ